RSIEHRTSLYLGRSLAGSASAGMASDARLAPTTDAIVRTSRRVACSRSRHRHGVPFPASRITRPPNTAYRLRAAARIFSVLPAAMLAPTSSLRSTNLIGGSAVLYSRHISCALVSRFRSSPELAARSDGNFGIERPYQL